MAPASPNTQNPPTTKGIECYGEDYQTRKLREWSDIQADARALDAYMEKAPPWVTNVLVHALREAGRITRFPVPEWSDKELGWSNKESKAERHKMLAELLGQAILNSGYLSESKRRVRSALYELLHNPDCPAALFDRCAQFVCDQSNAAKSENVFHSDPVLDLLLKSVPADELQGAENQEARNVS
jgi:hypothetical protein